MLYDIYIFGLFFIILVLLYSVYFIRFSPNKIKIIGTVAVAILLIRYICALVMLLTHSMVYLYALKIPYFVDFLGISILIFILFYVFIRRNYINFNYVFLFSIIAAVIYIIQMYKSDVVVRGMDNFGYTMLLKGSMPTYWIYIIFITVMLFLSIIFSRKPNVNSKGLYMLVFSAAVTIVENIGLVIDKGFFPANIFGDLLFIITFIYALSKLRK
ncbi:MAG: hypothetical protein LKE46_13270 [Clostridium sp.]|jgi:hypothetical protein|uniref:hypothetical protein n=1 Tax=Clostridium sp. TaxID=1506 RepID=UPI0025B915B0|nr:hypothetical protein [Clostridium sp.]MCH3965229.1 hypothetical protein [Clostridium sp.]MCI1714449.1 hypothetical protein [Clostridium sp.]MCI1798711.1 hypothetical protein [Clostridium sp.]MCI1812558.1 hypothetical protein [Clostridium sp.]MCI1869521.1 hypothetical protein [Clostridium sp.]